MSFLDLFDPPSRREAGLRDDLRAEQAARRASAINAARSARLRGLRDEASIDRLHAVIREQDQELAQLTLALTSLVDLLAESGAVDPWVLQARIAESTAALAHAGGVQELSGRVPQVAARRHRSRHAVPAVQRCVELQAFAR